MKHSDLANRLFKDLSNPTVYILKSLEATSHHHGVNGRIEDVFNISKYLFRYNGHQLPIEHDSPMLLFDCHGRKGTYHIDDLQHIILEDVTAAKDYIQAALERSEKGGGELLKRKKEEVDAIRKKFNEVPNCSDILSLDFSSPKKDMNNIRFFIKKGVMRNEKEFLAYSSYERSDACSTIKSDKDNEIIQMYLPVNWVNYAGYDEKFVLDWMNEVKSLTGFDITYLGKSPFKDLLYKDDGNTKLLNDNLFYVFSLDGEDSYMLRYFVFMCMRYLYIGSTNNIPGLTMQIKKTFDGKLDFLNCLLFAHCIDTVSGEQGIGLTFAIDSIRIPSLKEQPNTFFKNIMKEKIVSIYKEKSITVKRFENLSKLICNKQFEEAYEVICALPDYIIQETEKVDGVRNKSGKKGSISASSQNSYKIVYDTGSSFKDTFTQSITRLYSSTVNATSIAELEKKLKMKKYPNIKLK